MTKDEIEDIVLAAELKCQQNKETYFVKEYTERLLLECAKKICINCKEGNPSNPTNDPSRRVHHITANYSESCRATAFFIEGE